MMVIEIREPGDPDVLVTAERPTPMPGSGEVLIKVAAAGHTVLLAPPLPYTSAVLSRAYPGSTSIRSRHAAEFFTDLLLSFAAEAKDTGSQTAGVISAADVAEKVALGPNRSMPNGSSPGVRRRA